MTIDKHAQAVIHTASVAAAGVSASPIPFSDAALLVPIQVSMIMGLYKVYDQSISEALVAGAAKATVVTALGKSLAGNLLKFIPGVGTIAGDALNASVAVSLTEFIGHGIAYKLQGSSDTDPLDVVSALNDIASNFHK